MTYSILANSAPIGTPPSVIYSTTVPQYKVPQYTHRHQSYTVLQGHSTKCPSTHTAISHILYYRATVQSAPVHTPPSVIYCTIVPQYKMPQYTHRHQSYTVLQGHSTKCPSTHTAISHILYYRATVQSAPVHTPPSVIYCTTGPQYKMPQYTHRHQSYTVLQCHSTKCPSTHTAISHILYYSATIQSAPVHTPPSVIYCTTVPQYTH